MKSMKLKLASFIRELLAKFCEAAKESAQLWLELLGLSVDDNNKGK